MWFRVWRSLRVPQSRCPRSFPAGDVRVAVKFERNNFENPSEATRSFSLTVGCCVRFYSSLIMLLEDHWPNDHSVSVVFMKGFPSFKETLRCFAVILCFFSFCPLSLSDQSTGDTCIHLRGHWSPDSEGRKCSCRRRWERNYKMTIMNGRRCLRR